MGPELIPLTHSQELLVLQVQVARSYRIAQITHGRRTREAHQGNTGHELISTVILTCAPVMASHLQEEESKK